MTRKPPLKPPVEMVEKLKAYERQSDLARLTGIDDGEEEMILDLSVKKNMKRAGWRILWEDTGVKTVMNWPIP